MLLRKRAWDIMRKDTVRAGLDQSVAEAMQALDATMAASPENHTVLVQDPDGVVVGSVSIWDVLRHLDAAVAHDPELKHADRPGYESAVRGTWVRLAATPLSEIMDPHVPMIAPQDPLALVLEKMLMHGRSMAAVADAGKVLGTVHIHDVYASVGAAVASI